MEKCIIDAGFEPFFFNSIATRAVTLGIKVNNKRLTPLLTESGCKIYRRRRFTNTAFLIDNRNYASILSSLRSLYVSKSHESSQLIII